MQQMVIMTDEQAIQKLLVHIIAINTKEAIEESIAKESIALNQMH